MTFAMRTQRASRIPHAIVGLFSIAALVGACKDDTAADGGETETDASTGDPTGETTPATSTTAPDPDTTSATEDTGGAGQPPPTPILMTPENEAIDVAVEDLQVCWDLVTDPDGDPVKYRVFVDGILLMQGRLGEEGYDGPCLPLTLNFEQTYEWQVQAFNPDFPESESEMSEPWHFTTATDGFTNTVFDDPFDDDLGWDIDGDAGSGAWVRGEPVATEHFDETSQPGMCAGGMSCYFTGQNPDSIVDEADVSDGSTVLTSPEFDLSGAESATVQLSRFFYKSGSETGTLLRIELLTPDGEEPDGYRHHTLEQLESGQPVANSNMWQALEYAACGLPMLAGSRLRITATDLGSGITEGAIDSVKVIAHVGDMLCDGGAGSVCDPNMGPTACADDLLCCSQGAVNAGVFRCSDPVAGIDYDNPPATPASPGNGAIGCDAPDIFVDTDEIDAFVDEINIGMNSCSLFEGCVNGTGIRQVLRFNTFTPNIGSADMAMGVPSNHPDLFHYSECHMHYHFDNYAAYDLLDAGESVATGHKQAFCLLDLYGYAWGNNGSYDCGNQGISRGFADIYDSSLPCQWIDVTDVPPGDYTLQISLNNPPTGSGTRYINERNYDNNIAQVPVTIP
jgi:Lysyl oxidase